MWFESLFDDAALFPPGNAPMPDAVANHLAWRASPRARLVGPFVCAATRWDELVATLPSSSRMPVSLTVPGGPTSVASVVALDTPRARLVALEVPLNRFGDLDAAVATLDETLPEEVTGYLELPLDLVDEDACRVLAASRHHLKLRTGGTSAEAFPSETLLASAIWRASQYRLPFKLTAGLHHAVRHRDPDTGFEHHGFLNVLLATAAALAGGAVPSLEAALALRDPGEVVTALRRQPPDVAGHVRQQFESFGTCSIEEPLDDLVRLGLLT